MDVHVSAQGAGPNNVILVTGATGKVGQTFLRRLLSDPAFVSYQARALCHNRTVPAQERLEVVRGDIANRDLVRPAMDGVTHVVHAAHV